MNLKTSIKKTNAHRNVRAIRRKDSDSNESCIESESEDEQILFMEGQDSPVQITINGRKIKMVADTGCRQNIISSQLYTEQFKEHPLESTTEQFVAYGQKVPLTCLGRFKASLKADPNVKPVSQRLRRIPLSQIEQVNDEIDKMLKDDVIEEVPEPSPWVSNLVVVPKASGGLRVCCDFRELNKAIVRERYVLPKVEDTLDALNGSKYFAKIDARSGFFQLTLSEEWVEISVDDVIVHAVTIDQLINRLHEVFERCRERNLKLNPKKCAFRHGYPGEIVSDNGPQFITQEFRRFLSSKGIKHVRSSPYFPRSNGKIERFHRYLKKNFQAVTLEGRSWEEELPKILMSYRSIPHPMTGKTPASLLFHREIRTELPSVKLNVDVSSSNVEGDARSYQKRMKSYHDRKQRAKAHSFVVGDMVYLARSKCDSNSKLKSKFDNIKYVIIDFVGRDTCK
ncbi:Transposon Tf2-9 poly, partial [Paramuricea clavata]